MLAHVDEAVLALAGALLRRRRPGSEAGPGPGTAGPGAAVAPPAAVPAGGGVDEDGEPVGRLAGTADAHDGVAAAPMDAAALAAAAAGTDASDGPYVTQGDGRPAPRPRRPAVTGALAPRPQRLARPVRSAATGDGQPAVTDPPARSGHAGHRGEEVEEPTVGDPGQVAEAALPAGTTASAQGAPARTPAGVRRPAGVDKPDDRRRPWWRPGG